MPTIALVVFDWAGTTIDFGCLAPVAPFIESFARHGVQVTTVEAREPMGLHKREHLKAMLRMPEIAAKWRSIHGADASEADVDLLYKAFIPLQMEVIDRHSELVPELAPCVASLRAAGIKIGATTGYFRAAAERVYESARRQGYAPDHAVCAEDVSAGRPAPWMIFRIMEALNIFPAARVAKVGDTVPDIDEGLNAGALTIAVTQSSSEVGCSLAEWEALPSHVRATKLARARSTFMNAGAHYVIDSLAELPSLLLNHEAG
jgi:phosphonoacetaldehyde hydrolase